MITALRLENFKGVAARQRVEFAPLTLLFGPNSAGKSTILQALVYLHELLLHGRTEVDRTTLGGQVVELGGYERLVHLHDRNRPIILRVEYPTPASLNRSGRDLSDFPFPDLDDQVESAWTEITIEYRTTPGFTGPLITRVAIGVGTNRVPLVWLELGASLREAEPCYARINMDHPLCTWEMIEDRHWPDIALNDDDTEARLVDGPSPGIVGYPNVDGYMFPTFAISSSRASALPALDAPLRVVVPSEDAPTAEQMRAQEEVRTFLEMVVLGTTAQLQTNLGRAIYLGPLRAVPPRGLLLERLGPVTRWSDGLAAWDLMLADRGDLVKRTNAWLQRIGGKGYELVVQELVTSASAEDRAERPTDTSLRRLLLHAGSGTFVLPSEVGAGISQVVPVLVAALASGKIPLAMMEQPELHVHPALQTGLGDLFISSASAQRQFLIETHSEHLILRLLRRIRETTDGELAHGDPAFTPEQLSVIYVAPSDSGTTFQRLRVDPSGEFVDRWPRGFFEERAKELF